MLFLLLYVLICIGAFAFIMKPIEVIALLLIPFEWISGYKTVMRETDDAIYFYNHPPMRKEKYRAR